MVRKTEIGRKDSEINQTLTLEDARILFKFIAERTVCMDILDMVEEAPGQNLLSVCVEKVGEFVYRDTTYSKTVRHNRCKLLILNDEVCGPCKIYRSDIVSM